MLCTTEGGFSCRSLENIELAVGPYNVAADLGHFMMFDMHVASNGDSKDVVDIV